MFVLACVCALAPATAHADDGGWLCWLYRLDNQFLGAAAEIHLRCWDESGAPLEHCENWFRNVPHLFSLNLEDVNHKVQYDKVRHELNLRGVYYHTISTTSSTGVDTGAMNAERVMLTYHYHVTGLLGHEFPRLGLQVGGGGGSIRFGGDSLDHTVWSGVGTLSVVVVPKFLQGSSFRVEESYLTRGLTGAALLNNETHTVTFASTGEWSLSVGVGVNLWRVNAQ
jgi:hypothetical protein